MLVCSARQLWAAAVIESGKGCVKETGEVFTSGVGSWG